MSDIQAKKLSDQELIETEAKLRKDLFELRSKAVTQKVEKPSEFMNIRKDIARLQTERRQRLTKTVKA
jgi:large subunit ribosomal protein L29